jgi:hypothetical protein
MVAVTAAVLAGCGRAPASREPASHRPVPLPPDGPVAAAAITASSATLPLATTTVGPASTVSAAVTTTAPAGPDVSTVSPSRPDCALQALPAAATPEAVAAAFVTVWATQSAADDQEARLRCLRARLADPSVSPALVPPPFTPDQLASHWRLRLREPPAFAFDEDSRQAPDHVVLTGTLWAQVEQDGTAPVATISQLLIELVRPNGLWLVATMSNRTVSP